MRERERYPEDAIKTTKMAMNDCTYNVFRFVVLTGFKSALDPGAYVYL